jgi:feruloyl esterase
MKSTRIALVVALAGMILASVPSTSVAASCESLTSMSIPHGTVTLAQTVAPGAFTPPSGRAGGPGGQNPFAKLGSFCRVAVTLKPGPQSDVKAEVWLPSAGWNGKLQVVGNGGFAGTISYPAMATALNAGYAAASTDTGHTGPSPNTFANEDVLIDFAHRAIHETAVAAKATVQGFFGNAAKLSYFNGCSTGGRQAVTAAQRYPDDFDGIVAGAPASHTSTQAFGQIWFYQALADPAAALPKEKLTLLHDAVLNACDEIDGVKDGVLENPLSCKFDPQALVCKPGSDAASCLTPAQVDGVRRIYAGPSNPRTGEHIFAGLERGSELGWNPVPVGYAVDYFKYIVFKDPSWDPKTLNYDSDVERAGKGANLVFDATSHSSRQSREVPRANSAEDQRCERLGARVHGAWDGTLRRRERYEHVRHGRCARCVERRRESAGADQRFSRSRRQGRSHASALRVAAGCEVQRKRQHRRCCQFRL